MDDLAPIIWAVYVYALEHDLDPNEVIRQIEELMEETIHRFELMMMAEAQ